MESVIIDNRYGVGQFGVFLDSNTGDLIQGEILSATKIDDALFLIIKLTNNDSRYIRRSIRIKSI